MFRNPILWSEENQITGDTIRLISNTITEKLDSLKVLNNTFIIQKDSIGFNQIKGRNLLGKFIDNDLRDITIIGNGENIFYIRNDETKELIGVDKTKCSSMRFQFKNSQLQKASFITKPEGDIYPLSEFPENIRKLRGFIWRENEKPLTKDDIFIKDTTITTIDTSGKNDQKTPTVEKKEIKPTIKKPVEQKKISLPDKKSLKKEN